ncbi:ThyX-like thymidylate synthase [Streptomyces phage TunaTartare]|uniref:ThyX-like thymidylate synthase n=1 Tax=Streptomyces phage TunaTartare TaxID=2848887 RepID=A0A8F2E6N2_9CAUD|nr:thymidylate synthase [Streptomyces phage TunaTartare]QWT29904.1 ThyX-like thymidylate synthase [Streptomyces phage TunaTartare]
MTDKIEVLDKGYVRIPTDGKGRLKVLGDDLDPVNSAKVSFAKESLEFGDREAKLLAFLQREEHSSVFRHSAVTFEVYAPLFVARQWWKYAVASTHLEDQNGWNESSRRYVTEVPEFYIPDFDEWRSAPDNRKQGSGEPIEGDKGMAFTKAIEQFAEEGVNLYNLAMENGVCAEQARLFLPAYGLYVRWRWTASLGTITHFLHQRLEHDAQKEIQEYAKAVWSLTHEHFPVCMETIKKS